METPGGGFVDGGIDLREDVEILRTQPTTGGPTVGAIDWPCPFCRQRQPIGGSYELLVRNRIGPELPRWVMACQSCVTSLHPTALATMLP